MKITPPTRKSKPLQPAEIGMIVALANTDERIELVRLLSEWFDYSDTALIMQCVDKAGL